MISIIKAILGEETYLSHLPCEESRGMKYQDTG